MTVPVVVEVLETPDGVFTTQVLNTSASTAAGDTLIIWYGSDFYTFASMPNVTSSAGTCTLITSVSLGDNVGHQKVFICPVTSGGSKSITIPAHTDCDIHGVVWRISSTVTADVSATQFDPNNTTDLHVAPSVTTTGADRLLGCCWLTPNGPSWTGEAYAPPGSMTKKGETDASPFSAMMAAVEDIAAAGATGTRTATWVAARKYSAITVALAGSGGSGVAVTGRSFAAVSSQATVRKVAAVTAITSLAAAGRATVAKKAPASGASYVAAWSYRSQAITRAVTAICSLASFSRATARKVAPASGSASVATFSRAGAVHVGVASGTSYVAGTGTAQASKVAAISGRGVLVAATSASTRKVIAVNGRTYVAVTAVQIVPQEPADLVGGLNSSDRARAVLYSSSKPVGILRGGDE